MATVQAANIPGANSTPDSSSLDKQRVTLILDINSHLLEQIQLLQATGKGGDVQTPANPSQPAADPAEAKKPSREYVEPLRRMQANLAYLASLAERHQKPNANAPPWPQVMTAPPGDEKLAGMYARLQGLFPMWRVHQQRLAAAAQAQQQAGGGGQLNSVGATMGMGQQQGGGENMG
jgi:hypothetical protein